MRRGAAGRTGPGAVPGGAEAALTAESSSRWAGAITRTSEDACRLAGQNLRAEKASLRARIGRIQARLAIPAGQTRGYAIAAGRHAKTGRLKTLKARLARVERQADSGAVSVVRGGKALLRKRNNLAGAGLTEAQWRADWESARLFLTADGEKGKAWGMRRSAGTPGEGWLEVKLPAPLAGLANRPHGRYRLSAAVAFGYRGDEVAAQGGQRRGPLRYRLRPGAAAGTSTPPGRPRARPRAVPGRTPAAPGPGHRCQPRPPRDRWPGPHSRTGPSTAAWLRRSRGRAGARRPSRSGS